MKNNYAIYSGKVISALITHGIGWWFESDWTCQSHQL